MNNNFGEKNLEEAPKMIKTELCKMLGIMHPIIQAGMGPFGTNKLCIATANAGVLGLISSSGVDTRDTQPDIYKYFISTGGATLDDDKNTVLKKIFRQTLEGTKKSKGIFGVNVMVSSELRTQANETIDAAIQVREEDPEMRERFRVMFTSAGDPLPWTEKIKGAGFKWLHVIPSVKGALRCQKAGVDIIVASGHEGGFHTAWEPVHSMVLLPAVVDALAGSGIPVVGAGGFCDGKTLAAALSLGAAGVQMGTRFLATKESDFAEMWKNGVIKAGDRGTLIARGFVGPARWIKTPSTVKHAEDTLKMSPGVYLGKPDDFATVPPELIMQEIVGISAVYAGDENKAMLAAGECAQRIDDLPPVKELVNRIVKEAADIVENLPKRILG
jgi:NAD(P)H-dependent flavin oxidoreductase YrpB (nitropropane dioxygenase family)